MRYHYREQIKTKKPRGKKKFVAPGIIGLAAGLYFAATALSPVLVAMPGVGSALREQLQTAPEENEKRLYIPKIGVSEPIVAGGAAALQKGVWHRESNSGNPKKGDNFTVCAESFSMGWTPSQTRQSSPFYNLGKLAAGDQIFVDYEGERYGYEVQKQLSDLPDGAAAQTSGEKTLTLYPCTPAGVNKEGNVFIATSLGQVEEMTLGKN